ncbi:MAG: hypothetical protein AAGD32_17115 [Planctomycetota bacterium]
MPDNHTPDENHPNRNVVDRRLGTDRRQNSDPNYDGPERRKAGSNADRRCGLERRRGAGIRREEDRRSAEEGEMTAEQYEFIRAIETYKKVNKKLFPTWTEVLEVMEQLGYRKVEARSIDLPGVPDPLAGENTRKPTDLPPGETKDIEPEAEAA